MDQHRNLRRLGKRWEGLLRGNGKYHLFLTYALLTSILTGIMDHIYGNFSEPFEFMRRHGHEPPFGRFFGMNTYIYHLAGLYLGVALGICLRNVGSLKIRKWASSVILIAFGAAMMFLEDGLLLVMGYSLVPGLELHDLKFYENQAHGGG